MLLRDHPLLCYRGVPSWPPTWTWVGGSDNQKPRGEIGIRKGSKKSNIQPPGADASYISSTKEPHISAVFFALTTASARK